MGPFEPAGDTLTPRDWECLDGTLYENESGTTLQLTIHQPNKHPLERTVIWHIEVSNGMFQLAKPAE
ncbi:hypothetical protein [Paenibacillus plantarum]|nr:hypothetical protein [Paenibacillus plantarum]